jgi:hypothetical protein
MIGCHLLQTKDKDVNTLLDRIKEDKSSKIDKIISLLLQSAGDFRL